MSKDGPVVETGDGDVVGNPDAVREQHIDSASGDLVGPADDCIEGRTAVDDGFHGAPAGALGPLAVDDGGGDPQTVGLQVRPQPEHALLNRTSTARTGDARDPQAAELY